MLFRRKVEIEVDIWHTECKYDDFPELMRKLRPMLDMLSIRNLTVHMQVLNNPRWCASGEILDIVIFGSEMAKAFFDTHREMYGL